MTFTQLIGFAREWKRLRLSDGDFAAMKAMIEQNPEIGDVMSGTGALRKVRFSPPSRHTGKSGAFRVGYAYFRVGDRVLLATIFAKNQKENLTDAEKAAFKKFLDGYKP